MLELLSFAHFCTSVTFNSSMLYSCSRKIGDLWVVSRVERFGPQAVT